MKLIQDYNLPFSKLSQFSKKCLNIHLSANKPSFYPVLLPSVSSFYCHMKILPLNYYSYLSIVLLLLQRKIRNRNKYKSRRTTIKPESTLFRNHMFYYVFASRRGCKFDDQILLYLGVDVSLYCSLITSIKRP